MHHVFDRGYFRQGLGQAPVRRGRFRRSILRERAVHQRIEILAYLKELFCIVRLGNAYVKTLSGYASAGKTISANSNRRDPRSPIQPAQHGDPNLPRCTDDSNL
jgi:hypothetical protein